MIAVKSRHFTTFKHSLENTDLSPAPAVCSGTVLYIRDVVVNKIPYFKHSFIFF